MRQSSATMMTGRGMKKVSPDDMHGVVVAGDHLTGKAWRQGRFARRRHWGSGRRPESDSSTAAPATKLVIVPWRRKAIDLDAIPPGVMRSAGILGWLAVSGVAAMWLIVILDIIATVAGGGPSGWGPYVAPVCIGGLVASHLFGIACETLSASRCPWGIRAVVGAWLSLLVWVPVGTILSLFLH